MKIEKADLGKAHAGSYFTILGTGGDLNEWVEGVEKMLAEQEIGKPVAWFQATGAGINEFAMKRGLVFEDDHFKDDLICLMFPLEKLDVGKLALFKLQFQARWFDDIIDNMVKE